MIRRLGTREGFGRHEMSGSGPHRGVDADRRHVPGRGDLFAHRVGVVQHVEDRGEPGVEHAVAGEDHCLHVGNRINGVVSATDAVAGCLGWPSEQGERLGGQRFGQRLDIGNAGAHGGVETAGEPERVDVVGSVHHHRRRTALV